MSDIDLCTWLIQQIEISTCLERLDFIAECIHDDHSVGAEYLAGDNINKLRLAWITRKKQIEAKMSTIVDKIDDEKTGIAGSGEASKAKAQTITAGQTGSDHKTGV